MTESSAERIAILIIEDDERFGHAVATLLGAEGRLVDWVKTVQAGRERLGARSYDVVLADYGLPDGTPIALIEESKARDDDTDFVVITAHERVELAVEAIKAGAEQFLLKPIEFSTLVMVVERLARRRRDARLARVRQRNQGPFIGAAMAQPWLYAERIADKTGHVVIRGETGVGKGMMARWIHDRSGRPGPFVSLNCAGLNPDLLESELFGHERGAFTGAAQRKEGLFELARAGTLFLDEIGEMHATSQAKILKAVEEGVYRRLGGTQERTSDLRIIAASHKDLSDPSTLRPDLYFRLSTFVISIPPLRERRADVPDLVYALLDTLAPEKRLAVSPRAMDTLTDYDWPGNVRELRNVLERALALADGDALTADSIHLRSAAAPGPEPDEESTPLMSLRELEERHIRRVLRHTRGNLSHAARVLGISRTTLYKRLEGFSDGAVQVLNAGNG